jgi:hypothetical protein
MDRLSPEVRMICTVLKKFHSFCHIGYIFFRHCVFYILNTSSLKFVRLKTVIKKIILSPPWPFLTLLLYYIPPCHEVHTLSDVVQLLYQSHLCLQHHVLFFLFSWEKQVFYCLTKELKPHYIFYGLCYDVRSSRAFAITSCVLWRLMLLKCSGCRDLSLKNL